MSEPPRGPYEPLVVYERPGRIDYITRAVVSRAVAEKHLADAAEVDQEMWRNGVLGGLIRRSLRGLGDE